MVKYLSKKIDVQFLNLGYVPNEEDDHVLEIVDSVLEPLDPIRAHVNLYEKALSMCPEYPNLKNIKILEVGCGTGSGVEWISRAHPAIDSTKGVDKVVTKSLNGSIVEGNAENLPFDNNEFDMIVNIESSHLYANPSKFFKECARVLKTGGYLCWADIRYSQQIFDVEVQAADANLQTVAFEDITNGVLRGLVHTSSRYDKLIEKAPWYIRVFRNTLRTTYCAPGTESHKRLLKHEKIYASACWRKQAS
ncbi:hypothetical protein QR680_003027 [Steinernema hermaphroditum]|uniref:Methyltransferase type 11 domain-containing protein n=1 Tax=Steinernema hermaphroditum TaxID=289476 RepID=A0AA39H709_9BILA|nr:hypothetical protein QR680_003027 [Steinernema hermaphroditum]